MKSPFGNPEIKILSQFLEISQKRKLTLKNHGFLTLKYTHLENQ